MKLFVPACGDRVKLINDWTFAVFLEHRNMKFAEHRNIITKSEAASNRWGMYVGERYGRELVIRAHTIKTGAILEIDRVYIRQFSKSAGTVDNDFDSITFKIIGEKHSRFWVKLADVNTIECELESTYKQRLTAK
jgi:hypothetical protein